MCGMRPSGAPRLGLNSPTFKMEKWKRAVKMHDLGIHIREDEVYDGSPAGLIPFQASLSIQPMVEVINRRFYLYGSESDDSGISICSSHISWMG